MSRVDGALSHYRLENGKILITQAQLYNCTTLRGTIRRRWDWSRICLTQEQLERLAKKYLKGLAKVS